MMILDNLALFLRIVEKGGLAAAGRELGLSAASVSALRGCRLFIQLPKISRNACVS